MIINRLEINAMNTTEPPKYPVQTVIKAIEIINFLAEESGNRGVGISEFSRKLDMGKSTVHRLLDTLQYYGYVEKNEETNCYRLGWKLYSVGKMVPVQNQILNLDQRYLVELNKKTRETVNLGILKRNESVIISKIDGYSEGLRVIVSPAEREAVHATALGKVLISEMDDEQILALIAEGGSLQKYTDNTITNPDFLLREIAKVRKQGYAVDNQEYGIGLYCMARPVRDYTRRIIAAVSVSAPYVRVTDEFCKNVLDALSDCCAKISWDLGYRPE